MLIVHLNVIVKCYNNFHIILNNYYIPSIICLLASKSIKCYLKTFTHVLNKCNKRNFNFISDIVYADFEVSIHTALLTI